MARITTTDCERVVPNRFELVLLAAVRARALIRGDQPGVAPDGDQPTVIALREIAAGTADPIGLRQQILKSRGSVFEEDDAPEAPIETPGPIWASPPSVTA